VSVTLSVFLHGKPGHALDEGAAVTGQQLRDLGDALQAHLKDVGDAIDKLAADGWRAGMALYEVLLSHPEVATEGQARRRLEALGVDAEAFCFEAWEDEGEEDKASAGR
jgi:hypothetical protein